MGELWRIYQPQLLRFLRAKHSPAVDDVASTVWMDVGRSLHRFEGDGVAFQRWMFTIANRRGVDEARRVARRREVLDDGRSDQWRKTHADDLDASGALERAIAMVRQLPDKTAEAVMLRVVFDLSVTDAAEVMSCTEGNVRVLVHRGLNRLRELVEAESPEPVGVRRAAGAAGVSAPGGGLTIAAASEPPSFT